MEIVMLTLLALTAVTSLAVHRHHRLAAWNRELASAFGTASRPDLARRRRL